MHLHFTHPCNFLFAFRWWNFLWSVHHVLDITICILQIHHLLCTRHLLLLIHQMFDAATSLPRHIKNRTSVTSSPGFFSRNIFSCHTVMSWELARCNEMSFIPYLMSCLLCYCYCKWIGFPTYMKHIWNIYETPSWCPYMKHHWLSGQSCLCLYPAHALVLWGQTAFRAFIKGFL